MSDERQLLTLNQQYINALLSADVRWYQSHLSEDFVCIEWDGSMLDKATFLRHAAQRSDLTQYRLDRVQVRFYGDVALVQATGVFTRSDGRTGTSRYTDVYARMNRQWKVVSAQITRAQARPELVA